MLRADCNLGQTWRRECVGHSEWLAFHLGSVSVVAGILGSDHRGHACRSGQRQAEQQDECSWGPSRSCGPGKVDCCAIAEADKDILYTDR